jgi:23S rRNA (cytosine1962-C5)-methyltransferase
MTDNDNHPLPVIVLKKGREKPVRMGHPWIFSGSIGQVQGKTVPGCLCKVQDTSGTVLGYGYYNTTSTISVRMLSNAKTPFTSEALQQRISDAIERRRSILNDQTDSCRLINSEGDFIPGLIVDKVNRGLVVQLLTCGIEQFRSIIVASLEKCCSPEFIFERSDTESRKREGLAEQEGLLFGNVPADLAIKENDLYFTVDISGGQKTGYFFDQRINRHLLREYTPGKSVCDCFSYSGGFSVNALYAGASHVDVVDISRNAVSWAKKNIEHNISEPSRANYICSDVFNYLREITTPYDCIICDPPKFAKHPGEVERAARGYKDINLCALKKLNKNGILFTFSCSQAIDMKLFRQIVFSAAADSGRSIQLLHTLTAGPDHPVNIAHIEGEYLKGLVLRVVE